jgi:RAD51-like protein 2
MTGSFTPLGRTADKLISINKRFPSSCVPLDRLLGDGLPSGHVLELSGPPGTPKDTLATKFASSAVSSSDQVLFVGKILTHWQRRVLHPYCILGMENMASPASLHSELRRPKHCSSRRLHFHTDLLLGSKGLADAGLDLVHYLNIFTLPDLLIFLHNLPSFLEAHPAVSGLPIICPFRLTRYLSDPPRSTQLNLLSFPNLSGFGIVEASSITCVRETGLGQVVLLI